VPTTQAQFLPAHAGRFVGRWAVALLLGCCGLARALTPGADLATLEREGRAQPLEAARAIEALLPGVEQFSPQRLEMLTVLGLLLANATQPAAAENVAAGLDSWARARSDAEAAAAALLVRSRLVSRSGELPRADKLASEALQRLPTQAASPMRFRFLLSQARLKDDMGRLEDAVRLYQEAMVLADGLGEAWRRADARSGLAYSYHQAGQSERARALNDEAVTIAEQAQDWVGLARAHNVASIILDAYDDAAGELRTMQLAIEYARRAGARGDESLFLANLADYYLKSGDYKTALARAEQALPLARDLGDVTGEAVALANIGLAHISMRRIDLGKRYLREAIAIDEKRGSPTGMSLFYSELGTYLEKAGDLAGAAEAFHQHRKLADEILQRDQQLAILALQEQFDADRRTRELTLLNRENELKAEQLRRGQLQQRLWWLLAAVFVLSLLAVVLLSRRVRRTNIALASSNDLLKQQSERDPLTGLANRRHFHAATLQPGGGHAEGTLFLIDIDHFKRINDNHGHGVGDAVLVEVARRLRETLRDQDLIVRWGGEEFLVVVRAPGAEQVDALAQRLLVAVGGTPVVHDGRAIGVTGSIGYATFGPPPAAPAVPWERAIGLVDTAMYLAKAHGRNRAYGVRLRPDCDAGTLDIATRALESAWREGQVELTPLVGPMAVPQVTGATA